jgi:DNA-binding NarL/FixJ family response regulator
MDGDLTDREAEADPERFDVEEKPRSAADRYAWAADAAAELHRALVARDEAIAAMRAEGASLRAIAEAVGLSAAGVKKILDRPSP